jgi:hypothetical protein
VANPEYFIYVRKNILEPKHKLLVGTITGLYLFLLDRSTRTVNNEDQIHHGAPLGYDAIAEVLGCSAKSIQRWRKQLEDAKYIRTARTSHQGSLRWWILKGRKFKGAETDMSSATRVAKDTLSSSKDTLSSSTTNLSSPKEMTREMVSVDGSKPRVGSAPTFENGAGCVGTHNSVAKDTLSSATPLGVCQPASEEAMAFTTGFAKYLKQTAGGNWAVKVDPLVLKHGVPKMSQIFNWAMSVKFWDEKLSTAGQPMAMFVKAFPTILKQYEKASKKPTTAKPPVDFPGRKCSAVSTVTAVKTMNLPGRKSTNMLQHFNAKTI